MRGSDPDPDRIDEILAGMPACDVAYDVGANVGRTARILSRKCGTVYAYEPCVESAEVLRRTARELGNVVVRPYALSDHDGEVTLLERESPIRTGQLVSDVDTPEDDVVRWGRQVGQRTVPCRRLDGESPSPQLVKIDVEGHELKVVDGALYALWMWRPNLFIEVHDNDLGLQVMDRIEPYYDLLNVVMHPGYQPGSWGRRNHWYIVAMRG